MFRNVSLPISDNYTLSFRYALRTSYIYPPNAVAFLVGGKLVDTLVNRSLENEWFSYSKTFSANAGVQQLLFQAANTPNQSTDITISYFNCWY